ncbi:MAG: alkaline phosphatase family protein [Gaiellaceae bacterium]
MRKKLVLIVIDGLTPGKLERGIEAGVAPTLAGLAALGAHGRAISTFPSLTPVCLASIVTGAHPDAHHIPHLVWYHRGEQRLVEYGSSFAAARRAGAVRWWRDTVFGLNGEHLAPGALTLFERLEDEGLTTAAINTPCFRGRTPHVPTVPGMRRSVLGPTRFFYYNLFESDAAGGRLAVRSRANGSVDDYAEAAGRWLVTRDGFDFLFYYLSDLDYASHAGGPERTEAALARSDRSVAALIEAAGGLDAFLDRYAVVVCSDHGQSRVNTSVRLERHFDDLTAARPRGARRGTVAVAASNRAAMLYRLDGCPLEVPELALRLDGDPSAEVVLYRDGGEAVARRAGAELRFRPGAGEWLTRGESELLDHPRALERVWRALENPNAGELLVSAAPGYEFVDLGGRDHSGGGSHGSLCREDAEVPMLAVGLRELPATIADIAPAVLRHFGVEAPQVGRRLPVAA